jgi:octaprenyl-diphosphate synthase
MPSVTTRRRDTDRAGQPEGESLPPPAAPAATPLAHEPAPTTSRGLDGVRALVDGDLALVNEIILERMRSEVELIPQLARHLIAAGGKRVRPILTLLSARLCGAKGRRQLGLAAAVEFIHTATLLHDDVVDASDLRRGTPTANAVWGNKAPVLVGDFLFSRAFQLMVEDGNLRVLSILADASAVIAEGEVAQLITANDTSTSEQAYLRVIEAKTAALFRAACQIGAVVAERPAAEEQALAAYGQNLGVAFQLVDDALDYSAREALLGKTVGDDFRDGKITLPVVLAYARGGEAERAFWRRTLEEQEQGAGDLEHAQALLAKHGAITETVARAEAYGSRARASLAGFPPSRAKAAMLELVDFCVERAY